MNLENTILVLRDIATYHYMHKRPGETTLERTPIISRAVSTLKSENTRMSNENVAEMTTDLNIPVQAILQAIREVS